MLLEKIKVHGHIVTSRMRQNMVIRVRMYRCSKPQGYSQKVYFFQMSRWGNNIFFNVLLSNDNF